MALGGERAWNTNRHDRSSKKMRWCKPHVGLTVSQTGRQGTNLGKASWLSWTELALRGLLAASAARRSARRRSDRPASCLVTSIDDDDRSLMHSPVEQDDNTFVCCHLMHCIHAVRDHGARTLFSAEPCSRCFHTASLELMLSMISSMGASATGPGAG